ADEPFARHRHRLRGIGTGRGDQDKLAGPGEHLGHGGGARGGGGQRVPGRPDPGPPGQMQTRHRHSPVRVGAFAEHVPTGPRVRLPLAGPVGARCAACAAWAPGGRPASRALTVIAGTLACSVSDAGPGLRSSAATDSARSPASRSASMSAVTVWPAPTVQPSMTTSRGRARDSTARDRASLTWSGRPGPRPPETTVTCPARPALGRPPGAPGAGPAGAGWGGGGAAGGGPATNRCAGTITTGAGGRGPEGCPADGGAADGGAADAAAGDDAAAD